MKKGDIVVTNFEFNKKIHNQVWKIMGKDFSNSKCFCIKHLKTGKFLTMNKHWLRQQNPKTTKNSMA